MVSRSEGYLRGAGKEQLSTGILQEFLRDKIGQSGEVIRTARDNYERGDLRFPSGATIECKGQPIDPTRYKYNFVEVFEITNNPLHSDGFRNLGEVLRIAPDQLSNLTVTYKGVTSQLGHPPCLSLSVLSIHNAAFTAYVNYQQGGRYIYLYRQTEITSYLRAATLRGLRRGAGNSNEDTFAVLIPIASMRWVRRGKAWMYGGTGSESEHLRILQRQVTASEYSD
jgi:hypothetical protein